MAGLNDSFLADDSMEPKTSPAVVLDVFKDNPEDPDVPELRDDVDLIAVAAEEMQISMRDLDLLQESIRAQGGMSRQIALEAHAIMPNFLHDDRPVEYFTQMPSRTQLAAALEDIGSEKKSILKRMMEKLLEFIRKLAARIKAHFMKDPEFEAALREFAKNYNGPTDEQINKAAQKAQASAAPKPERDQTGDIDKGGPVKQPPDTTSTDAVADKQKATANYHHEKMALITAMLGNDRLALVAAMMSDGFEKSFNKAVEIGLEWTGNGATNKIEVIARRISELEHEINNCNSVIGEFINDGEASNRKVLSTWITCRDRSGIARVNGYFDGNPVPCLTCTRQIQEYILELEQEVTKAGHTDPQVAQEHLLQIQKEVTSLNTLVTLIAKVDNAYSTVVKGLRK